MNNINIASVIEKNKIASEAAITFALDIELFDSNTNSFSETLRLVNYARNVMIDGETYIKFPFKLDLKEDLGEISNIQLSFEDQSGIVLPYLRKYRGATKSIVKANLISIDPLNNAATIDFSETFSVMSSGSSNFVTTFELGAENPLTRSCPHRTQMRDRCSFRYKSERCGYKGNMPSCDLTLRGANGCEAHANGKRFGGFPSIKERRLA